RTPVGGLRRCGRGWRRGRPDGGRGWRYGGGRRGRGGPDGGGGGGRRDGGGRRGRGGGWDAGRGAEERVARESDEPPQRRRRRIRPPVAAAALVVVDDRADLWQLPGQRGGGVGEPGALAARVGQVLGGAGLGNHQRLALCRSPGVKRPEDRAEPGPRA